MVKMTEIAHKNTTVHIDIHKFTTQRDRPGLTRSGDYGMTAVPVR